MRDLFLYFEQPIPQFVMNTVMLLAYGMIVMILMSLGIALTQMKVFSFKDSIITSIGRVIIGPIIGLIVIKIFNLSGVGAGVGAGVFGAERAGASITGFGGSI